MTGLPADFLGAPIAHRGYHDASLARVENSMSAFEAAIAAGFGIELDVQMSRDGVPMVFHDATLDRLTALTGPVRSYSAKALAQVTLADSADTIAPLENVLGAIGDRTPVVVEIKHQPYSSGTTPETLAQATGRILQSAQDNHGCRLAVMSFNPTYIAALSWLSPRIPRGLVGMVFDNPDLSAEQNAALSDYAAFDVSGSSFVSHDRNTLDAPALGRLKARGVPILTWTVRNRAEEASARRVADNITFEGYDPRESAP